MHLYLFFVNLKVSIVYSFTATTNDNLFKIASAMTGFTMGVMAFINLNSIPNYE